MERSLSDVPGRRPGGQQHADRSAVEPADRSARSASVYIDGFNLYHGCLEGTEYRWLDLGALCERLLPRNRINHIHYFTSRVSERSDAPKGPEQQNAYLRALETVDRLTIHYGYFQSKPVRLPLADPPPDGPKKVEVIQTREKASDVNLATRMLLDAFSSESDIAVVISNDSDLKAPIQALIQELDVPVGLVNPHLAKRRSRVLLGLKPLFFKQIRPTVLRNCQFPPVLHDEYGEIRRPDGW